MAGESQKPPEANSDVENIQTEPSLQNDPDAVISLSSKTVAGYAFQAIDDKWEKLDQLAVQWALKLKEEIISCIRAIMGLNLPLSKKLDLDNLEKLGYKDFRSFFDENIFELLVNSQATVLIRGLADKLQGIVADIEQFQQGNFAYGEEYERWKEELAKVNVWSLSQVLNRLPLNDLASFLKNGFSSEEYVHYMKLHREDKAKGEVEDGINSHRAWRYIKRLWNERVDREFIQSLKTVHWGKIMDIEWLLSNRKKTRQFDLSTNIFLSPPYNGYWHGGENKGWKGGNIGLLVKGRVTYACNADAGSDQTPMKRSHHKYRGRKYSHGDRPAIFNLDSFTKDTKGGVVTEATVANWVPVSLVIWGQLHPEDMEGVKKMADQYGLNIVDVDGRIIYPASESSDSKDR